MSVPAIERGAGNLGCNNEDEKQVDADEKYGMFKSNAARHVWSEYMRLMTSEKRDEYKENSDGGEEIKSTVLCISRIDVWIRTVL